MEDPQAYQRAKKRTEAKIGFYIHVAVYVAVNSLLVVINFATSPENLWFYWSLIGWGIGLFFHGVGVFALSGDAQVRRHLAWICWCQLAVLVGTCDRRGACLE